MSTYLRVEDLDVYQKLCQFINGMEKTLEEQLPAKERRWPERVQRLGFRVQERTTIPLLLNPKP